MICMTRTVTERLNIAEITNVSEFGVFELGAVYWTTNKMVINSLLEHRVPNKIGMSGYGVFYAGKHDENIYDAFTADEVEALPELREGALDFVIGEVVAAPEPEPEQEPEPEPEEFPTQIHGMMTRVYTGNIVESSEGEFYFANGNRLYKTVNPNLFTIDTSAPPVVEMIMPIRCSYSNDRGTKLVRLGEYVHIDLDTMDVYFGKKAEIDGGITTVYPDSVHNFGNDITLIPSNLFGIGTPDTAIEYVNKINYFLNNTSTALTKSGDKFVTGLGIEISEFTTSPAGAASVRVNAVRGISEDGYVSVDPKYAITPKGNIVYISNVEDEIEKYLEAIADDIGINLSIGRVDTYTDTHKFVYIEKSYAGVQNIHALGTLCSCPLVTGGRAHYCDLVTGAIIMIIDSKKIEVFGGDTDKVITLVGKLLLEGVESAIEYNRMLFKSSVEKTSEDMHISMTKSVHDTKRKIELDVSTSLANLESLNRQIAIETDKLRQAEMIKRSFNPDAELNGHKEMVDMWFEDMTSDKRVLYIHLSGKSLSIYTRTLFVQNYETFKWHELGKFKITIEIDKPDSVQYLNLTRKIEGKSAPHVFSDGRPCQGTMKNSLSPACKEGNVSVISNIVISFLETVNMADVLGKTVKNWPEISLDDMQKKIEVELDCINADSHMALHNGEEVMNAIGNFIKRGR